MHHKKLPSYEKLHALFSYDPVTGVLVYKVDYISLHKRFCKEAGEVAGTSLARGLAVHMHRKTYYVHRLIWCMVTGNDPGDMEIDHRDRNKMNNRWENLRLADRPLNNWNTRTRKDNSSGYRGVHRTPNGGWKVQISVQDGVRKGRVHRDFSSAIAEAAELTAQRNLLGERWEAGKL